MVTDIDAIVDELYGRLSTASWINFKGILRAGLERVERETLVTVGECKGDTVNELHKILGKKRQEIRNLKELLAAARVPFIACPKCGRVSYNRNDIDQKYCGNCNMFHEDIIRQANQNRDHEAQVVH